MPAPPPQPRDVNNPYGYSAMEWTGDGLCSRVGPGARETGDIFGPEGHGG
jgi:hypothetical protein